MELIAAMPAAAFWPVRNSDGIAQNGGCLSNNKFIVVWNAVSFVARQLGVGSAIGSFDRASFLHYLAWLTPIAQNVQRPDLLVEISQRTALGAKPMDSAQTSMRSK